MRKILFSIFSVIALSAVGQYCGPTGKNGGGGGGAGSITGFGTTNYAAKWSTDTSLVNSLIYDNGINVGIGAGTTPTGAFQVISALHGSTVTRGELFDQYSTYGSSTLELGRYRGTFSSPVSISANDSLGRFIVKAYDGSTAGGVQVASLACYDSGTVATGVIPSLWEFKTMNKYGTLLTGLTISPSQMITLAQLGGHGNGIVAVNNSGKLSFTTDVDSAYATSSPITRSAIGTTVTIACPTCITSSNDSIYAAGFGIKSTITGLKHTFAWDSTQGKAGGSRPATEYYANTNNWNILGNKGTVDGTNFVGTTDNIPFNIRVNNTESGRIETTLGNTSYGYITFPISSSGSSLSAFGYAALQNNAAGLHNTGLGYSALQANTSGNYNTGCGSEANYQNQSGTGNTAVGYGSLGSNTNSQNTAVGYQSGMTNTAGNNNTLIGYLADVSTNSLTNATAIGANAKVSSSNSLVLGNGANVGINVSSPLAPLQVNSTAISANRGVELYQNSLYDGVLIKTFRSKGTYAAPTAMTSTDTLFNISVTGYDGSAYTVSGSLNFYVDGTVSSGVVPSKVEIKTANSSGTKVAGLAIDHNQNVIFNPSGSALSTSATNPFPFIPDMGGTPTGVPTIYKGSNAIVLDTLNNNLWARYGGIWNAIAGSGTFVPYSGAVSNVNLNAKNLINVNELIVGASSLVGTEGISLQNSQNAATLSMIENNNSGVAAQAYYEAYNGSYNIKTGTNGTGYTTAGGLVASGSLIQTNSPTLNIIDAAALSSGTIGLYAGGSGSSNERMSIDYNGNIVLNASGSALATNATNGFTYIPSCAGVPTGTPGTLPTGAIPFIVDASDRTASIYTAGAWNELPCRFGTVAANYACYWSSAHQITGSSNVTTNGNGFGVGTTANGTTPIALTTATNGSFTISNTNTNTGIGASAVISVTAAGQGSLTEYSSGYTGGSTSHQPSSTELSSSGANGLYISSTASSTGKITFYAGGALTANNKMIIDAVGNITNNATGSVLSTSATNGFTYLPNCSGIPTGIPANKYLGSTPTVIDSLDNMMLVNTTNKWLPVGQVANNNLTAQSAATTITSYTTPANTGTYRIGGYVAITAVATDVLNFEVTWTDENSNSDTQIFYPMGATSASLLATGFYSFPTTEIRVKASTVITVQTILATGGGSVTYDSGATIEKKN